MTSSHQQYNERFESRGNSWSCSLSVFPVWIIWKGQLSLTVTNVTTTCAEVDSTWLGWWLPLRLSNRQSLHWQQSSQENTAPRRSGHKSTKFSKVPIVIVQPTWTQVSQQIWENKTLIKYETSHVTTVTSVTHRPSDLSYSIDIEICIHCAGGGGKRRHVSICEWY